jgi:hypothetical protein
VTNAIMSIKQIGFSMTDTLLRSTEEDGASTTTPDRQLDLLPFKIAAAVTVLVLLLGFATYLELAKTQALPAGFEAMDKIGSFVSGLFNFIGVVWICATFYMQLRELSMQRLELAMQREASQSAAVSFRSQIVISLYERAIIALSQHIRNLCQLVLEDRREELADANVKHDQGNRQIYYQIALESSDFMEKVEQHVASDNIAVVYLLRSFCKEAQELEALVSSSDIPPEVRTYLYDLHPVAMLRQTFSQIIESQKQIKMTSAR